MSKYISGWTDRAFRVKNRIHIKLRDLRRSFDWYVRGGKLFFTRYYPEMVASHKWIFIVGCNNSGTSILQKLLGVCGEVSTLPFEGQMYTTVFPRARKRKHERVWAEYVDELNRVPEDPAIAGPRLVHDWMRDLDRPIKKAILEKTPANAVRMQWLQKIFPDSYFIGLVRDGYAVTEGIMRKGKKSAERGARHWNEVNRLMLLEAEGLNRFKIVKYEDLVDNTSEIMAALAEFLDIEQPAEGFAESVSYSFETVLGSGERRLNNMNAHSINCLSRQEIDVIFNIAAPMLERFGYEKPAQSDR